MDNPIPDTEDLIVISLALGTSCERFYDFCNIWMLRHPNILLAQRVLHNLGI